MSKSMKIATPLFLDTLRRRARERFLRQWLGVEGWWAGLGLSIDTSLEKEGMQEPEKAPWSKKAVQAARVAWRNRQDWLAGARASAQYRKEAFDEELRVPDENLVGAVRACLVNGKDIAGEWPLDWDVELAVARFAWPERDRALYEAGREEGRLRAIQRRPERSSSNERQNRLDSELEAALAEGHDDQIRRLLAEGASPAARGGAALSAAAKRWSARSDEEALAGNRAKSSAETDFVAQFANWPQEDEKAVAWSSAVQELLAGSFAEGLWLAESKPKAAEWPEDASDAAFGAQWSPEQFDAMEVFGLDARAGRAGQDMQDAARKGDFEALQAALAPDDLDAREVGLAYAAMFRSADQLPGPQDPRFEQVAQCAQALREVLGQAGAPTARKWSMIAARVAAQDIQKQGRAGIQTWFDWAAKTPPVEGLSREARIEWRQTLLQWMLQDSVRDRTDWGFSNRWRPQAVATVMALGAKAGPEIAWFCVKQHLYSFTDARELPDGMAQIMNEIDARPLVKKAQWELKKLNHEGYKGSRLWRWPLMESLLASRALAADERDALNEIMAQTAGIETVYEPETESSWAAPIKKAESAEPKNKEQMAGVRAGAPVLRVARRL